MNLVKAFVVGWLSGWVVDTTGRGGAARVYGWLLDVRSQRRTER